MSQSNYSDPFPSVIIGLGVLIVAPQVLTDPVIGALMATPLRQAASIIVAGGLFAGWSLWLAPGISIRETAADESSISNETSQPTDPQRPNPDHD